MPPPVVRVPKYIGRGAFVDVPTYTGNAGKALVVNGTGDGFAYVSVALAVHAHAGEDITSGTIADARIASTITRDSEVMAIVLASDGNGSGLDADLLDGNDSSAFATAGHSHTGTYQPSDAELTAIASLIGAANTVPSFTGPGAATLLTIGTAANNLVKLDANAKLPAVDGSQLTNLPGGGGGSPGGSTTQVQYNSSGAFAGDAGMTYDAVNDALTVSGRVVTPAIRVVSDGINAWGVDNAAGTVRTLQVDTTNGRARINNGSDYIEFTNESGLPTIRLFNSGSIDATIKADFTNGIALNSKLTVNGAISTTAAFSATQLTSQDATAPRVRVWKTSLHWFDWDGATSYQMRLLDTNGVQIALFEAAHGTGFGRVAIGTHTPTAWLDLSASIAARASLRIRSGAAPTTPNAGDIWFDGTNLKFYNGSSTITIA